MTGDFNNRVRQITLLLVLSGLTLLLFIKLYVFLPAFLGATTLYILGRDRHERMVKQKKWHPGAAAGLFMLFFLLCLGIPVYMAVDIISSRIGILLANQSQVADGLRTMAMQLERWTGQELLTDENITQIQKTITGLIPKFLNSTLNILANVAMMFFVVYYMFVNGPAMEKRLLSFIPLQSRNIHILAKETKSMVRANAIGIPLISIIQGITAILGYWIFGVKDYVLWGFMTGLFAFFPVVGTMIIWVPLVIYTYATGTTFNGTGLMLYSLIVTGNIDYFARITLLKKIGNVHPLITVLGVIAGLQLFGFWGFIFGPLLVTYLLLLLKIYGNEFGSVKQST